MMNDVLIEPWTDELSWSAGSLLSQAARPRASIDVMRTRSTREAPSMVPLVTLLSANASLGIAAVQFPPGEFTNSGNKGRISQHPAGMPGGNGAPPERASVS